MSSKPEKATSLWFDDAAGVPTITQQAQRMETFVAALADGHVDEDEVRAQEQRVMQLMREVEPQLSGELHAKVTQLLCELTAYDVMQVLHSMHKLKPTSTFRG